MADKLTPDELAAIQAQHQAACDLFGDGEISESHVRELHLAHADRAALLRHVEALEREVERLRATEKREARRSIRAVNIWKKQALSQREQRKSAERKLARLVEGLEEEARAWFHGSQASAKLGDDGGAFLQGKFAVRLKALIKAAREGE